MNDKLIENLLRKTPAPKAPAELCEQLTSSIRLSRADAGRAGWSARPSWFKQWLPALSFAVLLLTCVVVIGVQVNQLSGLRQENESLRAQNQNLDALREANAEVQRLLNENSELDRLRANNGEIQRLRNEVAQLRAQTEGLAQLRAENERLQAATKAAQPQPDFFAEVKDRHERAACVNNLKQLGVAVRVWANAHNGQFPKNFASMTNEIEYLKVLQCPGDKLHHVTNWAQVAAGDDSYQISTDGVTERDNPNIVVFECTCHHIIGLADGSVQMLSEQRFKDEVKVVDGRKVWAP